MTTDLAAEAAALARDVAARTPDAAAARGALAAAGLLDAALPGDVAVEVAHAVGAAHLELAAEVWAHAPAALAAAFCGAGRAALDLGMAYARERVVFGRPVARFQVQRHNFALATARLDAALALARRTGAGAALAVESAACVPLAADAAWHAAELALQVHGGYGYTDEYAVSGRWLAIATARSRLDRPAYERALLDASGA